MENTPELRALLASLLVKLDAAKPAPTLRTLWERYQAEHFPSLRDGSRKTLASRMSRWVRDHGDVQADKLRTVVDEYRARRVCEVGCRGRPPITWSIDLEIKAAVSVLEFGVRVGALAANPLTGVKVMARARIRKRTVSDAELATILAAANWPPLTALALACRSGGCRPSEVRRAALSDFDPFTGSLRIPVELSKTKTERIVYLSEAAIDAILAVSRPGCAYVIENPETRRPYCQWTMLGRWKDGCREAGLSGPDLVLHALRHSFGSTLIHRGATPIETKEALGLKSLRQVDTYAHALRPMASVFALGAPRLPAKKIAPPERIFLRSRMR